MQSLTLRQLSQIFQVRETTLLSRLGWEGPIIGKKQRSQSGWVVPRNVLRSFFGSYFKGARSYAFQIVKGGTGKTTLALETAVRAHAYGARVLCIDLDQQANLTDALGVEGAEDLPIWVDVLAEGRPPESAIIELEPGFCLLPSRIENAALDDVLHREGMDLGDVFRRRLESLKLHFDLVLVDSPPQLDRSVAATLLGVDEIVVPVVPDRFAMKGLELTAQTIEELAATYGRNIPYRIVFNQFDEREACSRSTLKWLRGHPVYGSHLSDVLLRSSADFKNGFVRTEMPPRGHKWSAAQQAMDALARHLLGLPAQLEEESHRLSRRTRREVHMT